MLNGSTTNNSYQMNEWPLVTWQRLYKESNAVTATPAWALKLQFCMATSQNLDFKKNPDLDFQGRYLDRRITLNK